MARIEQVEADEPQVEIDKRSVYYRAFGYLTLEPDNRKVAYSADFLRLDIPAARGIEDTRDGGIEDTQEIKRAQFQATDGNYFLMSR